MTGPEAAVQIVEYVGGGIGALCLYLVWFTDFFENISRRGIEEREVRVEVLPDNVVDGVRNVIDEFRKRIDKDSGATRNEIVKWERMLVDALREDE